MVFGIPMGSADGLSGAGVNSTTGASAQNQRTLTVIVNFTNNNVSDFKYHNSSHGAIG